MNPVSIKESTLSSNPINAADVGLNSKTLFDWLGSFWSTVYEDPDFVEYLQTGRSLYVSQLYLNLLENLKLVDRSNAPVFHRERWYPIVLRKSQRNTGSSGMFKLVSDGTVVLGKQTHEVYKEDTVITLGGVDANYKGMVLYPLDKDSKLVDVSTCLSNNIVNPSVVMGKGTGFAILDGAIAIAEEYDPFEGPHADDFPKFEVLAEDPKDNDVETVVWASDAMFDKDFIYTHLGYAMRLPAQSSELYKRVVNSAWNTVASGATPLLLKSLLASICGIPTVKEDGEVVEKVLYNDDNTVQVITDKNVYSFPEYTELKPSVKSGAVLQRFDTLDQAIHVYECVNDTQKTAKYNEFCKDFDEFTQDVPIMDLPPALFKADLENGFSVGWAEEDVVCVGFDKNNNPKLRFDVEGSEEDQDIFWEDIWESYESSRVSMETCLEGLDYDKMFAPGKTCGKISPMKFFMHNLIGANTLIITVRTDTLADDAPLYDPKFFGVVRECIPAYIRLYVIEHETVYEDTYATEGEGNGDTGSVASDDVDMDIYEDYEDEVDYGKRRNRSKYNDRVDSKWIAACRDDYDYDYDD